MLDVYMGLIVSAGSLWKNVETNTEKSALFKSLLRDWGNIAWRTELRSKGLNSTCFVSL